MVDVLAHLYRNNLIHESVSVETARRELVTFKWGQVIVRIVKIMVVAIAISCLV